MTPSLLPPVVRDDFAVTDSNASVQVDVLANDSDPDGTINPLALSVTSGPAHGTAFVQHPFLNFDDDGSPLGNGLASALSGEVDADGHVLLGVSGSGDYGFIGDHAQAGDYALFVRLGQADFASFDAAVFDFSFAGSLAPGAAASFSLTGLTPGTPFIAWIDNTTGSGSPDTVLAVLGSTTVLYTPEDGFKGTDTFTYTVQDNDGLVSADATATVTVLNQSPLAGDVAASTTEGMPVAIDVLASDGDPEGLLAPSSLAITTGPVRGSASVQETAPGMFAIVYTPDPHTTPANLVVDDPSDVDDGDYSAGHLSLREAIKLANADSYTDVFRYTVRDDEGSMSNEGTVTVTVQASPTTITFAPSLTAGGPAVLSLTQVGDTSEDNSALAITTPIIVQGRAGDHGITLAGPGGSADLRLFLVPAGGELTLEDLTLTNWATDDSGGVLDILSGGTAALTNCTLSNSSAYFRGGAIYNFGTATLTSCTLSNNSALSLGGGLYNAGTATLTNCTIADNKADRGGGFYVDWSGTTTLTGSSIINNNAADSGGGFYNSAKSEVAGTVLTDCTLSSNSARNGGAFYNSANTVRLTNCTLSDNAATFGGGFYNAITVDWVKLNGPGYGSSATLMNCGLTGNHAQMGGGFYNAAEAGLTNCYLTNNRADQGGGFFTTFQGVKSDTTLTNCTLAGNSADQGGGIFIDLGTVTLDSSTLSGNSAKSSGGGIFNNSTATLLNSTLAGNSAATGGGLFNGFGAAVLTNCTVVGNTASIGAGLYNQLNTATLTNTIVAGNYHGSTPSNIGGPMSIRDAIDKQLQGWTPGFHATAADGTAYRINIAHQLLRRKPGSSWTVLDDGVLSFKVAPDGTLYEFNDMQALRRLVGHDRWNFIDGGAGLSYRIAADSTLYTLNGLHELNRLVGRDYRSLVKLDVGVQSFQLAPSGTVYYLNAQRELRRVVPGSRKSSVLDVDVESFSLAPSGRVYSLNHSHELKRLSRRATWSTLDTGVQWYTMAPGGAVYELNDRHELKRLSGAAGSSILDVGVQWFAMAGNGTVYDLNDGHELKRLSGRSRWTILDTGVQSFALGVDGTLYKLSAGHELLMQLPGSSWTVLDVGVKSINVSPTGDVFWLNDHDELKQFKDGYFFQTDSVEVEAFAMTKEGTVFTIRPFYWGASFRSPGLTPVLPPIGTVPPLAEDPPDEAFVLEAAGISAPDAQNIAVVTELLLDSIDPPRFFPHVGLAQLHHAIWKSTIYFDTLEGLQVRVIATDTDHLHLYVPNSASLPTKGGASNKGQVVQGSLPVPPPATDRTGQPLPSSFTGMSMTVGPDGTLYRFGMEGDGFHWLGPNLLPRVLWRMVPGSSWQRVTPLGVYSYSVGPDNALYVLDANHDLRRLAPGADWSTIDSGVQSFTMAPDGTLYERNSANELRRLLPGGGTWSTLDVGVQSITMADDGTLYELNGQGDLKRLVGLDHWSTLDVGVKSFWMANDGTLYELNGQAELKRLVGLDHWTTLDNGVQSFANDFNGTIYALDSLHQLKRLTAHDHWVVLDTGVQSFVAAPSPLNDVYSLHDDGQLKRLEAGYSWHTLRDGVLSLTIDPDGTVHALDALDQLWLYYSDSPKAILPPIRAGFPPPLAEDPPDEALILRAAHIPEGPDVQVVTELLLDTIDSRRYFAPKVGPAELHHCHWKCTIYYTDANGPQVQTIYIDKDHLHIEIGGGNGV